MLGTASWDVFDPASTSAYPVATPAQGGTAMLPQAFEGNATVTNPFHPAHSAFPWLPVILLTAAALYVANEGAGAGASARGRIGPAKASAEGSVDI